jgi:mannose-6-phosphate isomerase
MSASKSEVFNEVRELIRSHGLTVQNEDLNRPWGGFFVLDENQIGKFIDLFFASVNPPKNTGQKLSPKILVVAPKARLSWQYHNRRSELWTILRGPVQVGISDSDQEGEVLTVDSGGSIALKQGQRHRLIGMDNWGVVAEIWQHTDPAVPSDEDDIIRVQDDYNR